MPISKYVPLPIRMEMTDASSPQLWAVEPPLSRREQTLDGPFEQVEHSA